MSFLSLKNSRRRRFEALVEPHLDAMYRFAYRLTGQQQDAEDLVQDVLVKLYPRQRELASIERLRPWLNRVLYRQFVDRVRKKSRQADMPFSALEEPGDALLDSQPADLPDISQRLDLEQLGEVLDRALMALSPDQRTLMLLYDVDGWSQEEVAEVLDIPLGTVKSRIHRCRAALRKKLLESPELIPDFGRVKG